jgi:hypothetical protein
VLDLDRIHGAGLDTFPTPLAQVLKYHGLFKSTVHLLDHFMGAGRYGCTNAVLRVTSPWIAFFIVHHGESLLPLHAHLLSFCSISLTLECRLVARGSRKKLLRCRQASVKIRRFTGFSPEPALAVNFSVFQITVVDAGDPLPHGSAFFADIGMLGVINRKTPRLPIRKYGAAASLKALSGI